MPPAPAFGDDAFSLGQFLPSRDLEGTPDTGAGASLDASAYVTLGYQRDQEKDVVLYVRSPLASYWRGQILDVYDGKGWSSSVGAIQVVEDRVGRLWFADAPTRTGGDATYVQSFFLKVSQPDALFTGYSPGRLVLPDIAEAEDLKAGLNDSVQLLRQAGSYRTVSTVPQLTPEALRRDWVDRSYLRGLDLPDVPLRVHALAMSIVAGAASDYDQAVRLERFLLNNYDYDLRVSPFALSGDVVDRFLFERRAGYCSQFATAMAVMARSVGLPARVVTGYLPGAYNTLTGLHVARYQDAHAWVEIKFQNHGWVPFDPTPKPDSPWALDVGFAGATKGLQQVVRAELGSLLARGSSALTGGAATLFSGPGMAGTFGAVAVTSLVMLALALVMVARRRRKVRRDLLQRYTLLTGTSRHDVREVYRKALRLLAKKGYPHRQAHQSPGDYIAALQGLELPVPETFRRLSYQAADALYDPRPMDPAIAREARSNLRSLRMVPGLAW